MSAPGSRQTRTRCRYLHIGSDYSSPCLTRNWVSQASQMSEVSPRVTPIDASVVPNSLDAPRHAHCRWRPIGAVSGAVVGTIAPEPTGLLGTERLP